MTHPITVELLARERQEELIRLAEASGLARRAAARGGGVRSWRRAVGRVLVAFGVRLAVPSNRRGLALRHAAAALDETHRCPDAGRAAA